MKIAIIVQARLGSTRLPGKILKPFYKDEVLLSVLLEKLHMVKNVPVIVATSTDSNNDKLATFLLERRELVFRGSENDVLNRFISTASFFGIDGIIRICSDNPFIDVGGLMELIETASKNSPDYVGFRINGLPSILTHFGFWGEYVKLSALEDVERKTEPNTPAHEHVTIHVYKNPNEYKCIWIDAPSFLQGRDDIRLTIDTEEDFRNAQIVYSDLMLKNKNFTLIDVVNYLDNHIELKNSMRSIISQNNKKLI